LELCIEDILCNDPTVGFKEIITLVKNVHKELYEDVEETLSKKRIRNALNRLRSRLFPLSNVDSWAQEINEQMRKEVCGVVLEDDGTTIQRVELEYPAAIELLRKKRAPPTLQV
jgi:hypothetical protein